MRPRSQPGEDQGPEDSRQRDQHVLRPGGEKLVGVVIESKIVSVESNVCREER